MLTCAHFGGDWKNYGPLTLYCILRSFQDMGNQSHRGKHETGLHGLLRHQVTQVKHSRSTLAPQSRLPMMGDRGRITVKHVSLELSIEAMQKQCTLGGVRVGVDSNGKLWNRDSRLEARQKDF
ncbi:hypothetical protein EV126DRAFT_406961 [Verticillium dahliae]|nr:hypothetical protein EV126DRAFT_406961 [Verticillium dahliae]